MKKKVYMQPVMEILKADLDQQILALSVTTTGLGDDDLALPDDEEPKSDDPWEFAW